MSSIQGFSTNSIASHTRGVRLEDNPRFNSLTPEQQQWVRSTYTSERRTYQSQGAQEQLQTLDSYLRWLGLDPSDVPDAGGDWDPLRGGGAAGHAAPSQGRITQFPDRIMVNGASSFEADRDNDSRDTYIYGSNVDFNIPDYMSAQVSMVNDPSNPSRQLVKIVTTSAPDAKQHTYYLSGKVNLHASDSTQIHAPTGADAIPNTRLTQVIGATADSGEDLETNARSEQDDLGNRVYESTGGRTLNFTSVRGENSRDKETRTIYGNTNISVSAADEVDVSPSEAPATGYTVSVTHRNGSIDTYIVMRGRVNIEGASNDQITFGGQAYSGSIPTGFSGNVFVNQASSLATGSSTPTTGTDTPPDSTSNNSDGTVTATYGATTGSRTQNVAVSADFNGNTNVHNVRTTGTFTVHANQGDRVNVLRSGTSPNYTYNIIVTKNGPPAKSIVFNLEGPPSRINIDADARKINYPLNEAELLRDTRLQIGANGTGTPTPTETATWPTRNEDFLQHISGPSHGGDVDASTRNLIQRILGAVRTHDDSVVQDAITTLTGMWPSQTTNRNPSFAAGPALRRFFTALYRSTNGNMDQVRSLINELPANLKNEMTRAMQSFVRTDFVGFPGVADHTYGPNEKGVDDQFTNQEVLDLLQGPTSTTES